jgi:hypothetical protein
VPKTRRALDDGILDILTTVPGLRVDCLKRRSVLGGIAVRRQYRGLPKISVDAFYPDRIGRIDLALREERWLGLSEQARGLDKWTAAG